MPPSLGVLVSGGHVATLDGEVLGPYRSFPQNRPVVSMYAGGRWTVWGRPARGRVPSKRRSAAWVLCWRRGAGIARPWEFVGPSRRSLPGIIVGLTPAAAWFISQPLAWRLLVLFMLLIELKHLVWQAD
jgi:hypothetical protein